MWPRLLTVVKENLGFIVLMLALLSVRSSIADWYHVPSGSMQPTISIGDRIFVDKAAYRVDIPFTDIALARPAEPAHGDIVIINSAQAHERLVKRVVGLPGDSVRLSNNHLIVNNTRYDYRKQSGDIFVESSAHTQHQVQLTDAQTLTKDALKYRSFGPVTVPAEHVLVLGDNRNHSADSRVHGFVPMNEIAGKATAVLWSWPENSTWPDLQSWWEPLK
ncbi:signal peptidase I [Salinimonas marina]|uniref:Signal peptidase I n=1 Tax=Salinimonas marina TaxID=2785918 RepID=A0A7S9DZ60_9ALTE|nr:signal peptidase I [Salinimonas marina]QPG06629.1 signal peptidase I [Salinimonas marina]